MNDLFKLQFRFRGLLLGLFQIFFVLVTLLSKKESNAKVNFLLSGLACTVFLFAVFLRVFSAAFIGRQSSSLLPGVEKLCQEGVYAHIRHPLYASNCLAAFSMVLFSKAYMNPFSWMLLGFTFLHHFLLSRGEDKLTGVEYTKDIPAFIPKSNFSGKISKISLGDWWVALKDQSFHLLKLLIASTLIICASRKPYKP